MRRVRNNAAGDALLSDGELLALRRGRPTPTRGPAVRAFEEAIDATRNAATTTVSAPGRALALHSRDGRVGAHAGIHSVPGAPHGARSVLLVQPIEGDAAAGNVLRRALREGFDLTEREADLCAALDTGATVAEAAHQVGVSLEGARTRLKSVFQKTGMRGQEELARFLAALRTVAGAG